MLQHVRNNIEIYSTFILALIGLINTYMYVDFPPQTSSNTLDESIYKYFIVPIIMFGFTFIVNLPIIIYRYNKTPYELSKDYIYSLKNVSIYLSIFCIGILLASNLTLSVYMSIVFFNSYIIIHNKYDQVSDIVFAHVTFYIVLIIIGMCIEPSMYLVYICIGTLCSCFLYYNCRQYYLKRTNNINSNFDLDIL